MKPATIDGRQVIFVDTPAFYNRALRNMDSSDVLKRLAGFFTRMQQNGKALHAAVFIHPKASRQNTPWLVEDAERNWPVFYQLVGEGYFPNVIFVNTSWSSPPTQEQVSREGQIKSQEPFRSRIQRVNWASGPSPQGALDILRVAMRRTPRQMAIQHDILDRRLQLADTTAGRVVVANSKQLAQQLKARGNSQGAQQAAGIEGRLRQGFEQEAKRWPIKQKQPAPKHSSSGSRPAPKPTPKPTPVAQRPKPVQPVLVPRPSPHASANKQVRQHGPVANQPMAYQPGRTNNNIQMQQIQPNAQPGMRIQPVQTVPPVHHHHHHTTYVHTPPNHQSHSPRTSLVQNNTSYHNYSYEEHNNTTNTSVQHTSPSSNALAAGAGLAGGAALGYLAYEALNDDNNSVEVEDQWDSDDLYVDGDINNLDDSSDYVDDDPSGTYADNFDSYGNNDGPYADDSGNGWSDSTANVGTTPAATYADDGYSRDYSGGQGADSNGGGDSGDGDGCCDCDNCYIYKYGAMAAGGALAGGAIAAIAMTAVITTIAVAVNATPFPLHPNSPSMPSLNPLPNNAPVAWFIRPEGKNAPKSFRIHALAHPEDRKSVQNLSRVPGGMLKEHGANLLQHIVRVGTLQK
ncbi:hypothetical protein RhiLY_11311 [Ceratobasidium sp. AG-Ba]|nr:hypothetical protein RhiLY_11311 [Ceratobasidium sp. AG-Ba]